MVLTATRNVASQYFDLRDRRRYVAGIEQQARRAVVIPWPQPVPLLLLVLVADRSPPVASAGTWSVAPR